jgi:hypothetical protein
MDSEKKKWGAVPNFIKEHVHANFSRTQNRSQLV